MIRGYLLAFACGLLLVCGDASAQAQPAAGAGAGADKPAAKAGSRAARAKQARAERRNRRAARGRGEAAVRAPRKPEGARPESTPAPQPEVEKPAPAVAPASSAAPASAASPPAAAPAYDPNVRTEGDTQVKMMEFSGLDIEGQLRTPQMLYFLNRMRAEFGRPKLPHRSFMPELQRSTRGKAF